MLSLGNRCRSIGNSLAPFGDKVVSCESLHSLSSEILAGYHSKDGFVTQHIRVN
jgi:hypothetical protein